MGIGICRNLKSKIVYDRDKFFGLGPKPIPKLKIVVTLGLKPANANYRAFYQNTVIDFKFVLDGYNIIEYQTIKL